MLYVDTCVLLAVLMPEVHSPVAAAFLEEASAPLAISSWSVTELHSALGLKVRTKALSESQAEAVLQGFERSLAPGLLVLELEPQDFRNANGCLRGWSTCFECDTDLLVAALPVRHLTLPAAIENKETFAASRACSIRERFRAISAFTGGFNAATGIHGWGMLSLMEEWVCWKMKLCDGPGSARMNENILKIRCVGDWFSRLGSRRLGSSYFFWVAAWVAAPWPPAPPG